MADKRMRSPDFPYITLRDSIANIERLYGAAKINFVPVPVGLGKMGISLKSSLAQRGLASMLSYGLLSDKGTGKEKQIKVSDLARKIMIETNDIERLRSIRDAALNPPIMRKAFDTWGASGLPDENTIKSLLELQWGFTDRAAVRFASVVRENFDYARLDEYIETSNSGEPLVLEDEDVEDAYTAKSKNPITGYQYDLSLGKDKTVFLGIKARDGKISRDDFAFLLSWLQRLDIIEETDDKKEDKIPF